MPGKFLITLNLIAAVVTLILPYSHLAPILDWTPLIENAVINIGHRIPLWHNS